MALKNSKNGHYIKIDLTGNYLIYESEKERLAEKEAPTALKVKETYQTVLADLYKDEARLYYDPEFKTLVNSWQLEYATYCWSQAFGKYNKEFPLISQYFSNVKDSLPKIILTGTLGVKGSTLQEVYEFVKHCNVFEAVEDC